MVDYKVTVYTQDVALAGTVDNIYVTLVGTSGESEHTKLKKLLHKFSRGDVSLTLLSGCIEASFTASCDHSSTSKKEKRKSTMDVGMNKVFFATIYHIDLQF